MAKKIKLSEIKVKSFNTILDKDARKATKGGYYHQQGSQSTKNNGTSWTANTIVDIREPSPFTSQQGNKKGKLGDMNGLNP